MAKWAIIAGVALMLIGVLGYWQAGAAPRTGGTEPAEGEIAPLAGPEQPGNYRSITALIPAAVGLLLLICGLIGLREPARKHAMHAAAAIATLGALLPLVPVGRQIWRATTDADVELNFRSLFFSLAMFLICAAFVVGAVRSFVAARRARVSA